MTIGQKVFLVLGVGTLGIIVLPKLLAPQTAQPNVLGALGSVFSGFKLGSPSTTTTPMGATGAGTLGANTTVSPIDSSGIDAGSAVDYSSYDSPVAGETYT